MHADNWCDFSYTFVDMKHFVTIYILQQFPIAVCTNCIVYRFI